MKNLLFVVFLFLIGISVFGQNTYYSKSTNTFRTLSAWSLTADGSGASPSNVSEFDNGLNTFVIQNGNVITLAGDITINDLVLTGTSSSLTIGNSTTARTINVRNVTVATGTSVTIANFTATHNFNL